MIRTLKQSDLISFIMFCQTRDQYSDFYITHERERLFLTDMKVCEKVFNLCLKHGDKCFISEKNGDIVGVALITGYSDKFHRKYLKIFAQDKKVIDDLFKMITWQVEEDLYIKIKKFNPVNFISQKWGFRFQGDIDKRVLLYRKYDKELAKHRKFNYVKADDNAF